MSESSEGSAEWLAYLPAHRQIELFRHRRFSPLDVLEAQIRRIEAGSQSINAVTCTHFDEARLAAKESEVRYHRGEARALEGVSVAVKEEYESAGWKATAGSVIFADRNADQTHPVLDKLRAAGAILHIQTTVPEFFLLGVTWSDLWGITRNPWNPDFTPEAPLVDRPP